MNKCRKSCIIPTPVHIGDAMFIADGLSKQREH